MPLFNLLLIESPQLDFVVVENLDNAPSFYLQTLSMYAASSNVLLSCRLWCKAKVFLAQKFALGDRKKNGTLTK